MRFEAGCNRPMPLRPDRRSSWCILQLLVQFANHHCLDLWQQFGGDQGVDAQRSGEGKCRTHVPTEHGTGDHAQLATEATDQIPDLPTFRRLGPIQSCGAVGAAPRAGRAVPVATAEGPVGEGAKAFFSASRISPLATYCV